MHTFVKNEFGFSVIHSEKQEIDFLNDFVDSEYKKHSEMSEQDRNFLNSLVLRIKPKKILELGIAKGASSGIILNAIKEVEGSNLYSVDINENCYCIPEKRTGFYMDNYPELKKKWTLYLGGTVYDFIDEIGDGIDFCLIDTVHSNPGEILDVLGVLPYLKQDAIIVLHDVNLCMSKPIQSTNNNLVSAITGDKIIPDNSPFSGILGYFNNISAIKLNENSFKNIYEIFNLLTLKWNYLIDNKQFETIKLFCKKHYGVYWAIYFQKVFQFQRLKYFLPNKSASITNK